MRQRSITIGFSTSRRWNPLSAIIKWWWGTEYSHVYIRWSTPWGYDEILEASGLAVKQVNDKHWGRKNRVILEYKYPVTKQQFNRTMAEVRSMTGVVYSYPQLLGIAFAEVSRHRRNIFSDKSHAMICSEVARKELEILGFDVSHLRADLVTPYDIQQVLEKGLSCKNNSTELKPS